MAVYTLEAVKANIRVRDGKRVFYLAEGDRLTPSAGDWLKSDGVIVLHESQKATPKPEHMTHLRTGELVSKADPRIEFRGLLDTLQAEILLFGSELRELLDVTRQIMRCDVLKEPLPERPLCGLSAEELRDRSHNPQKYYDQPHFMPDFTDPVRLLQLNRLRTLIRQTELAACRAPPEREDLIRTLNRMSSFVWILMIQMKAQTHPTSFHCHCEERSDAAIRP